MAKRRRTKRTTQKMLDSTRRIVVLCMRIAEKQLNAEIVDLITSHVIAKLPTRQMHRLVKGDCGKPMLDAMMLTARYFAT